MWRTVSFLEVAGLLIATKNSNDIVSKYTNVISEMLARTHILQLYET